MAEPIAQVLFTQTTSGVEKARFELLMRRWRRNLLNDKAIVMSVAEKKAFVNSWLQEFEEIFRNSSAKINLLSGYTGFISANGIDGITSDIDVYLNNYRQTVAALTNKDLVQARGLRNNLSLRLKGEGLEKIYSDFNAFTKEARALGLTQRERVDAFLNSTGKQYSTIQTRSARTGAVRLWRPDKYARMYANTRDSELRDEIFQDQLIENDIDIVQVSDHGTDTPICMQFEGQVYSLMGETPGLPVLQQRPPFHPNCKHVLVGRPRLPVRNARKINFKASKQLASNRQSWSAKTKLSVDRQERWNITNKPPKAGLKNG